ncbi:hypothetical protein C5167_015298, partial [Papaver somniferum]
MPMRVSKNWEEINFVYPKEVTSLDVVSRLSTNKVTTIEFNNTNSMYGPHPDAGASWFPWLKTTQTLMIATKKAHADETIQMTGEEAD